MKPPAEIWLAAPHIREGDLRPIELVEKCLERIDSFDERIQAWVMVDADGARAEAVRLGEAATNGQYLGPLHGIPIGIKDIVDVQGMPTRAGSDLTDEAPACRDAPVVAQLRAAGAIILGKTVTTEFACFDPPPTRNPWNIGHSPGGSSSGSAAAVSARMCLAALGSQTGGSLTRPATYCGVASCKPSFGRIDVSGVLPVSKNLDHIGPIASSVADLTYLLDAMVPGLDVIGRFTADLRANKPPTLGLLQPFFMEVTSEAVLDLTHQALDKLAEAGATIVPSLLPSCFNDVNCMHRRIMAVEVAKVLQPGFTQQGQRFGSQLTALLEEGLATSEQDYRIALDHQKKFSSEIAETISTADALITPATPTTAPTIDSTGDPRFNSPWSFAGVPTVSIPCGVTEEGMPSGLQLIGRHDDDARLLSISSWCERNLMIDAKPPLKVEG